jgi:hypothetical protein
LRQEYIDQLPELKSMIDARGKYDSLLKESESSIKNASEKSVLEKKISDHKEKMKSQKQDIEKLNQQMRVLREKSNNTKLSLKQKIQAEKKVEEFKKRIKDAKKQYEDSKGELFKYMVRAKNIGKGILKGLEKFSKL